MRTFILPLALILSSVPVAAQEKPPIPHEEWGVCPFECCTYREWTAEAEIPVHQSRSENSPVIFRLRDGEKADALTGVVVTTRTGVVKLSKPAQFGYIKGSDQPQLSLPAGSTVYPLSFLGEGAYLFWYHGKVYDSGAMMATEFFQPGGSPETVWWKKVRNKAGKTGWSSSDKFGNADACG